MCVCAHARTQTRTRARVRAHTHKHTHKYTLTQATLPTQLLHPLATDASRIFASVCAPDLTDFTGAAQGHARALAGIVTNGLQGLQGYRDEGRVEGVLFARVLQP